MLPALYTKPFALLPGQCSGHLTLHSPAVVGKERLLGCCWCAFIPVVDNPWITHVLLPTHELLPTDCNRGPPFKWTRQTQTNMPETLTISNTTPKNTIARTCSSSKTRPRLKKNCRQKKHPWEISVIPICHGGTIFLVMVLFFSALFLFSDFCFPASLLFCCSSFPCFSASPLFCFSDFCFSAFLPFPASLLLCFSASLLDCFFTVLLLCCFTFFLLLKPK